MITLIYRAIKDSNTYALVTKRPVLTDHAKIGAEAVEVAKMLNLYITSEAEQKAIKDALADPEFTGENREMVRELAKLTETAPLADDETTNERISRVNDYLKFKGGQVGGFEEGLEKVASLDGKGNIDPDSVKRLLSLFIPEQCATYFHESKTEFEGIGILRAMVACSEVLDIDDMMFSIANTMVVGVQAGVMKRFSQEEYAELENAIKADKGDDLQEMLRMMMQGIAGLGGVQDEIVKVFKPHFVDSE